MWLYDTIKLKTDWRSTDFFDRRVEPPQKTSSASHSSSASWEVKPFSSSSFCTCPQPLPSFATYWFTLDLHAWTCMQQTKNNKEMTQNLCKSLLWCFTGTKRGPYQLQTASSSSLRLAGEQSAQAHEMQMTTLLLQIALNKKEVLQRDKDLSP